MKNTTLCYIERDGKYLMIHRTKKEKDENRDKWLGLGGKMENGESPYDCVRREVQEEAGVIPKDLRYRGIVTFVSNEYGTEYMHLFHALSFDGILAEVCDEGELEWVEKCKVSSLPIWEGDKIFLNLLDTDTPFFSLKLCYVGQRLVSHVLEY